MYKGIEIFIWLFLKTQIVTYIRIKVYIRAGS